MLTILEAIQKTTGYFERKGIESARVNAELLLAEVLGKKRLELYLSYDQPLKENEMNKYRSVIARRGKFEPLQYIIGHTEFFGYKICVDQSVLIPRPESEVLIEMVIDDFGDKENLTLLDIGTGSGCLSIALAKKLNNVHITAVDISYKAARLAEYNAKINEIADKIKFLTADINSIVSGDVNDQYDIVISNPPYVSLADFQNLQPEIKDYEPKNAVTDNEDGYSFYKKIAAFSQKALKTGGALYLETGQGMAPGVEKILEINNFSNLKVRKDYLDIERVIKGIRT